MTEGIPLTEHKMIKLTGDVIKRLRKAAGLTQGELADHLDVDISSVWNWEHDRAHPASAERALEIVTFLEADFEPSDQPSLLSHTFTVNEEGTLAAKKPRGEPPIVYKVDAFVDRL